MRVAIVGCGKIADQHVQAIDRIPGSRVVAACDREPLMAAQLAERFGIEGRYHDVAQMLRDVKPDAVHITTPPQSHFELGRLCIEAGSHVYLEKPFTVTASETEALVALAERKNVVITAGHNCQFVPEMLRMRELLRDNWLGGRPVHIESYWPYDLGDTSYVGPLLANPDHWVRRLPGQLFHNIISHGVARLAEFLDDEVVVLNVSIHQSEQLRRLGGGEVMDEMRVLMRDSTGLTATFSFSTQMKPGQNCFRLYGPVNSLTVDLTSGSVIRHASGGDKSYLTFVRPQLRLARQYLSNSMRNFRAILGKRLYQDSGMKELIEQFHNSAAGKCPPPIPYREIVLTSRLMDRIFDHYPARQSRENAEKANVAAHA
jgi:predicted dehydrogenase